MQYILILLMAVTSAYGMTPAEIKNLATKEHKTEGIIDELKMVYLGKVFECETEVVTAEGRQKFPKLLNYDKVVDRKYLISEMDIGEGENKLHLINVTTYSKERKKYLMWSFIEKADVFIKYEGIHLKGSNIITWYQLGRIDDKGTQLVCVCQYNKDSVVWTENRFSKEGKNVYQLNGKATKIK